MIAAILDPGGRDPGAQARLERAGASATTRSGPLWLGWTGAPPVEVEEVCVLVDAPAEGAPVALLAELAGAARGRAPGIDAPTGLAWFMDEQRGVAVRDVTGQAPLFVCRRGEITYVASELCELLALLPVSPDVDGEAAALWLAMEPLGRRTLYAGVAPVLPAHWLSLDLDRPQPYWEPTITAPAEIDREDAAARAWSALRAAVSRSLAEALSPAVRLSGGLDSSAVLAAAADLAIPIPSAISTVFPDHPDADESALITFTAQHLGAVSRMYPTDAGSPVEDGLTFLARWGVPQEYPGRGLFHGMLAAAAKEHDVVLDGEGGDELFGCEPYLLADLVRRGRLAGAVRLARRLPGTPARLPARAYGVLARRWVVGGLAPGFVRPPVRVPVELDWFAETLTPSARDAVRARRAALDWRTRSGPRWLAHRTSLIVERPAQAGSADYLRRTLAMADVRPASPFTDPRLVTEVLSLPPEHAFDRRRDKELLRVALAGRVPDAVRLRVEKSHFGDPVIDALDARQLLGWLTPELSSYVDIERVRRQVEAGPEGHPRGVAGWMFEAWRAAMLGAWLTR